MMFEVVATVFIAAYIGLVIFGHGLLLIAILKCLRDDDDHLQRNRAGARPTAGAVAPPEQAAAVHGALPAFSVAAADRGRAPS
jgi:hypothetical protein